MSSDFDAQFDAAFEGLPEDPDDAVPEGAENTAAPLDYSQYTDTPEGFRSGFVSFVGRPNTGKSTLTNALVGQKIAITADQPETCLLYTSPSPRDGLLSRMPSSA